MQEPFASDIEAVDVDRDDNAHRPGGAFESIARCLRHSSEIIRALRQGRKSCGAMLSARQKLWQAEPSGDHCEDVLL